MNGDDPKTMTKDEIINEIKALAQKLRRAPSRREFKAHINVPNSVVRRFFGSWTGMLMSSGVPLERRGPIPVEIEELFRDWAEIARKTGRIPTQGDYEGLSKFSVRPLLLRFHTWKRVPEALLRYAAEARLDVEYKDVLDIVTRQMEVQRATKSMLESPVQTWNPHFWERRPVYGAPMLSVALCEPCSESGVVFLFGMVAKALGFAVTKVQQAFPDCEAFCRIQADKWQQVKIEFELASRNFMDHMHDPAGCDIIVCWVHDWPDCPLPVIELKTEIKRLLAEGLL